jgi:hypothetical protein
MSIDSDGYHSFRIRKAKKPCLCPECGKTIDKGEEYLFSTMFIDGGIYNSKMCKECESIVDNFFPDGYQIGNIINDLECYIDNSWIDDIPSSCVTKLTPKAKVKVCDILQRYQEE